MSDITTVKTLNMKFGNADGNKSVSLSDPLDNLTAEVVSEAMNEIVVLETLLDNKGNLLDQVVSAEIETVTKQTLF